MHRPVTVLALVVALVGPLQGAGKVLGRTYISPKQLVLTTHDLPRAFRQVMARSVSNVQADRADQLAPGTYAGHGRITSYETLFQASTHDVFSVHDNVIAFKSSIGAHWEFLREANRGRRTQGGRRFVPVRFGRIGNESAGFLYQATGYRFPVTCGVTIFRRGSYAAWILSCGYTRVYPLRASAQLAHIVDRRIQRAG